MSLKISGAAAAAVHKKRPNNADAGCAILASKNPNLHHFGKTAPKAARVQFDYLVKGCMCVSVQAAPDPYMPRPLSTPLAWHCPAGLGQQIFRSNKLLKRCGIKSKFKKPSELAPKIAGISRP